MPHRARAQYPIGRPDPSIGIDQRRHDPGTAEPIARSPGDQIFHGLSEIQALRGVEAPDQQIPVFPGPRHFGGQLRAFDQETRDASGPVAPRGTPGRPQKLHPCGVEGEARWRRKTAEQRFVSIVGAYQPPGTIGHRNRIGAAFGDRARDAPVRLGSEFGRAREQATEQQHRPRRDECGRQKRCRNRRAAYHHQNDRRSRAAAGDRDQGCAARRGRGRWKRCHRPLHWAMRRERQGQSGQTRLHRATHAGRRGAAYGLYQTFTRSAGARYSFSPAFTPNALYQASTLRTSTVRNGPGECSFEITCERKAGSRNLIRQTCA
ncbi:hypothetical protein D9M73_100830 [compost metagenome]